MIGVSDIGNIIYKDSIPFGIKDVFQKGNVPQGEILSERIVIYPKMQQDITFWKESFVEVNICVPNIDAYTANLIRLNELERNARLIYESRTGIFDDTRYRYKIDTIGIEQDPQMKCHYVNVSLIFEVLNVK